MSRKNAVFDFASSAAVTNDVSALSGLFVNLINEFGFACFAAGRVSSGQRQRRGGDLWTRSEHAWLCHWSDRHYEKVDPIVWFWRKHLNRTVTMWSEVRRADCGPRPELFEEAREFGLREGLAVGFKLIGGDFAVLSSATHQAEIVQEDAPALGFAAFVCVSRLAQLLDRPKENKNLLTGRQRECLNWVAAGKTDWEISQIVGLSERTVQEHIGRCVAKLDAANRTHAVAIAVLNNQISL